MTNNQALIETFYKAFAQRDWKTMQACYADQVVFSDPAFRNLQGKKAKAMWHMLAEAAQNFSLTFERVAADEEKGTCRWNAHYDFSRTGKRVHNVIDATFTFKDGKIVRHTDHFDLWRWSRMALGWPGVLLGWTPFLQKKIQETALKGLEKFIQNHPEYAE